MKPVANKPISIQSRRKKRIEEEPDEGEIIYNVIDPDQDAAFAARWEGPCWILRAELDAQPCAWPRGAIRSRVWISRPK